MEVLAKRYYDFLMTLPFDDQIYMQGISEGKRKFLSNAHIYLTTRNLPIKDKRYTTDFITPSALKIIKTTSIKSSNLQYEHIVPKSKYIHDICEQKAKSKSLSVDFIKDLLTRYYWTATVTETEHKLLKNTPKTWDGQNIKIRYENAGISLLPHNLSYFVQVNH